MRCNLPIVWRGKGLAKKQRTEREFEFIDLVNVDIREVDSADAPICVAANWGDVRYFDEGFWYPVSVIGACIRPREEETPHDEVIRGCLDIKTNEIRPETFYHPIFSAALGCNDFNANGASYETFREDAFRSMNVQARTEKMDKLTQRAKRAILIDGYMWVRAGFPVLHVVNRNHGRSYAEIGPMDGQENGLVSLHGPSMIFDLAMDPDTIKEIALKHLPFNDEEEVPEIPEWDVLMNEATPGAAGPIQFMRFLNGPIHSWWGEFSSCKLNDIDTVQLKTLTRLIDASRALNSEPTEENADLLESRVQEAIDGSIPLPVVMYGLKSALKFLDDHRMSADLMSGLSSLKT